MTGALTQAPWISKIARVFDRAGAPLYLVGGAVRNPLMGLPISDVDVCGPIRPEAVCAFCQGGPVHAVLRAAHFGTVELHVADDDGVRHMAEYTTFREDSYRCGHKPDAVRFTTELPVDALRRDFSVNALYQQVHPEGLGPVIDPTGGLTDMAKGVLHTVTPDPDQVLRDDGLRILRAVRFQSELDLQPTPSLIDSLKRHASLLGDIACERLRDEWEKILKADLRYPTLRRRRPATASGLLLLDGIGAWPCLAGNLPFDPAAARATERLPLGVAPRMALLFHQAGPDKVLDVMRRLRFSNVQAQAAAAYVRAVQGGYSLFDAAQMGLETLQTAAAIRRALGQNDQELLGLLAALADKPLSLKELAVGGDDLRPLFVQKGVATKQMGPLLHDLWRFTIEGRYPNQRQALLDAASGWLNRLK